MNIDEIYFLLVQHWLQGSGEELGDLKVISFW
jgi:hypothetical protein